MSLKSFTDFESNLEEESRKLSSSDSKGAKKQLLKSFTKDADSFITGRHKAWDLEGDSIKLATGNDRAVIVKVIGFDSE